MVDTKRLKPIFDADVLVYACGFAADSQMRSRFLEENPGASDEAVKEYLNATEYTNHALANTKTVITDVLEVFSKDLHLYLTGSGNFREHIATLQPYKGNRDPDHKPKYYRDIKDYLRDFWGAQVINGREADDAMGCHQWEAWFSGRDDTVLVTIDKDLDNIPGYHYNWRKKELYYIDLEQADRKFWLQVLTGDRTDNIPGLIGVGDKTAEKILANVPSDWMSLYDAVLAEYKRRDYTEADFHENATLLWIQRTEDKNYDDKDYVFPDAPPF